MRKMPPAAAALQSTLRQPQFSLSAHWITSSLSRAAALKQPLSGSLHPFV
ncbi:unnamed protein product [Laminaria digitata]